MMKYLKNLKPEKEKPEQNRISTQTADSSRIRGMKQHVYRQAALTGMVVVLTVVILFAVTSAWYTNVVQTSGLTFEAQGWGFEGKITLESGNITAAPGDEGIIDLIVENDNASVSAISVNVSKNAMSEEMQKRLFFYVDVCMNRNQETMQRVYLNRYEGYTYNVFQNSILTLTETYSNAPVVKWEWVYDVLGYYVLGSPYTVTAAAENGAAADIQKMDVKEYLRPILYDFDQATTKINTEGEYITIELETVDGEKTPAEFLAELSKTDGYEGVIDTSKGPVFDNYYAVDVDENGYGVYAYLCNYSQIQEASRYDTNLGQLAKSEELSEEDLKKLQHPVTISLSAQKNDDAVVPVSTADALQEAVKDSKADVIRLDSNIILSEKEPLLIPEGRRVMFDLDGHEITGMGETIIAAEPGSVLVLTNGSLVNKEEEADPKSTPYGVQITGAEVIVSNMQITGFEHGIYIVDNREENVLDARVRILDSVIEAKGCGVFISGNGFLSDQKSQLIIENSTVSGGRYGISGNGDASGSGRWGTDIRILGSTILSMEDPQTGVRTAGIYQPQKNSTLLIRDSKVEGGTGVVIKGGSVSVYGSTIIGNGAYTEPVFAQSGFTDTGDAVYAETNYGYEISLYISADSVLEAKDAKSLPLRVFEENASNVHVEIEDASNETTGAE